jgi:hypothetical protein
MNINDKMNKETDSIEEIFRLKRIEIKAKIEVLEKLQEQNKVEFYILIASTPSDNYEDSGIFVHRTDYLKERANELWESITNVAKSIALLYAALQVEKITKH